jgi:putative transposase
MRLIDEHYLKHPDKGARRMYVWLKKDLGYPISLNRVNNLYYNKMALRSILPGPHTSKRNKEHKTYPYLLRGLEVKRPNQVWGTDITYIPMKKGFMYLIAVIDLYSRYVVHWSVSNSMEAEWCSEFIQEAFDKHGAPDILNTDQGAQFTSTVFTSTVLSNGVKLSMDGKGRATDNAFIERLWRSVKYEKIYVHPPKDGVDLYKKIKDYMYYYNNERRHSSINDEVPSTQYVFINPPLLRGWLNKNIFK